MTLLVSISDWMGFLRCRLQWDWMSPNRMNRMPKRPVPALMFGGAVHLALELFYREARNPVETFMQAMVLANTEAATPLEEAKLMELIGKGEHLLLDYLAYYGERPTDDRDGLRVLVTEQEFKVVIPGMVDAFFVGTVDGLCIDVNGDVWVLEHKTHTRAAPIDGWMLSEQTVGYVYAMQRAVLTGHFEDRGVPRSATVRGTLYNGLQKAVPRTGSRFTRQPIRVSRGALEMFQKRLVAVATEMRDDPSIYPTPTLDCVWQCGMYDMCLTARDGIDVSYMLQTETVQRPDRGIVYRQEE